MSRWWVSRVPNGRWSLQQRAARALSCARDLTLCAREVIKVAVTATFGPASLPGRKRQFVTKKPILQQLGTQK